MKILFAFLLGLSSICFTALTAYSQTPQIEISSTTEVHEGTTCYVHTVQPKQTVYSLCRAYSISYNELIKFNPELVNGLKIDQKIYIPKISSNEITPTNENTPTAINTTEVDTTKSTEKVILDDHSFYMHIIRPGQTIYRISKIYNVTTDTILAVNDSLSTNLTIGEKIKIPCIDCPQQIATVKPAESAQNIGVTTTDTLESKPENNVAETNDSIDQISEPEDNSDVQIQKNKHIDYAKHIIDTNETVYSISLDYKVPPEVIYNFNPELKSDSILKGKEITIPTNGKYIEFKYIYFEVFKNAQLGQISQQFRITDDELVTNNPRASKDLQAKSFLQIPINAENRRYAVQQIYQFNDYTFHCVAPKETVYSITRTYEMSEKEFYKLNPTISKSELSIGTVVKVTKPKNYIYYVYSDTITRKIQSKQIADGHYSQCFVSEENQQTNFNVVIMLPFFLKENFVIDNTPEIINKPKEIHDNTYPILEYYEGILVGLDSLKRKGITVNIQVFDTRRDSASVYTAINKINKENIDLIIGPVFPNTFEIVSNWAGMYNIPIINPISGNTNTTLQKPHVIQVNPTIDIHQQRIAEEIMHYHNANIIIVYNSVVMEQARVDYCKSLLLEKYKDSLSQNNVSVTEILFPEHGMKGIEAAMTASEQNIIIVVSKNQAFINNLVTKLYRFAPRMPIQLYGLSSWERYENIELDFLFDLNLHFSNNGFVQYDSTETKVFIQSFRDLFKTEPTKYSFQGYDQIIYFIEAKQLLGDNFLTCLQAYPKRGLYSCYKFLKENDSDGYINSQVEIIEYNKDTYKRQLIPKRVSID